MVRKMNPEESVVHHFLLQLNMGEVIYEPDGNKPPDFSINSKIAVEARRLNLNFHYENSYESLETLSTPLKNAMDEVFRSFDVNYQGNSYLVGYNFSRPMKSIKSVKKELIDQLKRFLDRNIPVPATFSVSDKLEINIYSRIPHPGETFRFAGNMDDDDEGSVHVYIDNINLCIREKNQKIESYKDRYPEWWLALVDKTVLYPDEADLKEIKQNIIDLGAFTRLCIINPNDLGLVVDIRK